MERDDIIEYSLDAHHSDEQGVKIRKKIYLVTLILSVITIVEVFLGIEIKQGTDLWPLVKWSFIVMTLIKAGYIVMIFMHLGDERRSLKWTILAPYITFILYLIFICIVEAFAIFDMAALYR